jgi:hypothetical protein
VFLVIIALAGVLPPMLTSGPAVGLPGIVVIIVAGAGWSAAVAAVRVTVCERALIMDTLLPPGRSYVVPYEALDPSSVILHSPPAHSSQPYKLRASGEGKWPDPAMNRYIAASQSQSMLTRPAPLNVRAASWIHYGISFRGLHPVLASPYYRAKGITRLLGRQIPPRLPGLMQAWYAVRESPRYRTAVSYHDYPVIRWVLRTEHPERLLRALENAMVSGGFPDAAGMTDRALSRPYAGKPRVIPDDPAVW